MTLQNLLKTPAARATFAKVGRCLSQSCLHRVTLPVRRLSTPAAVVSHHIGSIEPWKLEYLPELQNSASKDAPKSDVSKTLIRTETAILRNRLIAPFTKPSTASPESTPNLVFLDGLEGVGKSTLTAQAVVHARSKGFIVIYIPDARLWTDGPGFFCPVITEGLDIVKDGMQAVRYYDRPFQTAAIFSTLLQSHADLLAKISCTPSLCTETTAQCETLLELVQKGEAIIKQIDNNWKVNPALATEVLHQVIHELSANKDIPFALVIDNYHCLIGMTCMMDDRRRRLHANAIRSIAQLFGRDAIEQLASSIQNGFVLLSAQEKPPFMEWRRSRVVSGTDFPLDERILRDASGRIWLRGFRERVADELNSNAWHISLPDCLPGELKAMCATFALRGLKRETAHGEDRGVADRLVALAGGRGTVMKRIFDSR